MKIFADTSTWMPNYRFGYILVWAGLVIGLVALFLQIARGGEALSIGVAGFVVLYSAAMVVLMPRRALNAEEEQERRRKAKEARRELR